jgi:hypothetical protein
MSPRLFVSLLLILPVAGCATGRTVRATDAEDGTGSGPVSLSPTPSEQPEPEATSQPEPTAQPEAPAQPEASVQPEAPAQPPVTNSAQGYAAYGGTSPLEIRRIGQWTRTGIAEARRLVIRDANGWAQFWAELGTGERPDVDFTKDLVIAVAAGQRPSGGYEIAIESVNRVDGELSVSVVERSPSPNCVTTASLTQPVDVVVVPAAGARSWSFLERKEIQACK